MREDYKLKEKIHHQLENFIQFLTDGLSKPQQKFVHQMMFGIQAGKDIKFSEIARVSSACV